MDCVLTRCFDYSARHKVLRNGDAVLLGVSGGKDSMFGFELLRQLQKKVSFSLEAFCTMCPAHLYSEDSAFHRSLAYIEECGVRVHRMKQSFPESKWTIETACIKCKQERQSSAVKLINRVGHTVIIGCFTMDDLLHYLFSYLAATRISGKWDSLSASTKQQFARRFMRFIPRVDRNDGGSTAYPMLCAWSTEIEEYLKNHSVPYASPECSWATSSGRGVVQCRPPALKHAYCRMLQAEYEFFFGPEDIKKFLWNLARFQPDSLTAWPL